MSEPALALAFFDPDRRLYGIARAGATLLFEDTNINGQVITIDGGSSI